MTTVNFGNFKSTEKMEWAVPIKHNTNKSLFVSPHRFFLKYSHQDNQWVENSVMNTSYAQAFRKSQLEKGSNLTNL